MALLRAVRSGPRDQPLPLDEARRQLDANGELFAVPDGVAVQPVDLDGLPGERSTPPGAADADGVTLLYLHGGSYVAGSLHSHRPLCARLAVATGAPVVAVDYRLAPEHPHPAALDDALTAYRWLLSSGQDTRRLVLAGDSAGAGLAVATLLSLGAAGLPSPAGAVLLSPWLDLTLSGDSIVSVADADPMLTAATLRVSAASYAGDDLRAPLVSPVYAPPDRLATLPPLLVLVGTADILLDDSRVFAARARAAGVAVDLDVEEGLMHVWPFVDGVPEAATALERIGAWVRERTR